jgi:mannose-6-phosphate isomerase-like protein (cupin superfamily)
MANVTSIESLRDSPRAVLFEGGEDIDASIFVVSVKRGEGPDLHVHPYPEVFVVQSGAGRFTVGEEETVVEGGNIVVVPAETPHMFKGASEETLRLVSFHPSPEVVQTDL